MANDRIGVIDRAILCAHLPEKVEVRKSAKGKKYPLYIATRWGSWFLNTPAGQEILLEHSTMDAPAGPIEPVDIPELEPAPPPPEPEPELAPEPEKKKPGFLDSIFGEDDE